MTSKTFGTTAHVAVLALLAALAGCGGADSTDSTTAYPLQAGYTSLLQNGQSTAFTVSGDCTGVATVASAPAVSESFEGVTAEAVVNTSAYTFTNCTPASQTSSSTDFYNASYQQIGGEAASSTVTGIVQVTPTSLPATVQIGSTGTLASIELFTDSTAATADGHIDVTYTVTADTVSGSTSAIFTLVEEEYDAADELVLTTQTAYRMTTTGVLTRIGIDQQYSVTSTTHLVLTAA